MLQNIHKYKPSIILAVLVILIFLVLRIPGINQIYHQDEYRWGTFANPIFDTFNGAHPPLVQFFMRQYGSLFGYDTLRVVPLMFSFGVLLLIFVISRRTSGSIYVGIMAATLYAISVYSVVASLQLDIDGAALPFFVLLSFWAYQNIIEGRKIFYLLLGSAIIGGFLAKESYALCLAVLAVDAGLRIFYGKNTDWKKIKKTALVAAPSTLSLLLLIYIYYAAEIPQTLVYFKSFFSGWKIVTRAYAELGFKLIKVLILSSPLLLYTGMIALGSVDLRKRYRFWWMYLGLNIVFYTILFDFTRLTIERYFMFLIAPLCIIGAEVIYKLIQNLKFTIYNLRRISSRKWLAVGAGIYLLILILIIPHDTIPLNPKNAYIERIVSLGFNFLIPITGGSGPVGFYVSALFTAVVFMVMGIATLIIILAGRWKTEATAVFLVLGVLYNLVFGLEYLTGWLYGSVPQVARAAVKYVNKNSNIKEVITYYDIGAYELKLSGKYLARFYTAPTRDYTARITGYRGHYMIVDFPSVGTENAYWKLISRCSLEKQFTDKQAEAYIFDCTKLPPDKN